MFFDAPDIALVAHGDIAVVAPQKDLGTLGDNVALTIDSGIDRCLGPTVADGFDLLDGICHLHEPQRAGEQVGLKVRAQAEAHHGHIVVVHNAAQLVNLVHREKLTLVHDDHIALSQMLLPEPGIGISVRRQHIRLCAEADAAGQGVLPVPQIRTGL